MPKTINQFPHVGTGGVEETAKLPVWQGNATKHVTVADILNKGAGRVPDTAFNGAFIPDAALVSVKVGNDLRRATVADVRKAMLAWGHAEFYPGNYASTYPYSDNELLSGMAENKKGRMADSTYYYAPEAGEYEFSARVWVCPGYAGMGFTDSAFFARLSVQTHDYQLLRTLDMKSFPSVASIPAMSAHPDDGTSGNWFFLQGKAVVPMTANQGIYLMLFHTLDGYGYPSVAAGFGGTFDAVRVK